MSEEIPHRLSTEGVDPLTLAGLNDGNLVVLAQRLGVRVSLRGDALILHGPLAAVERAGAGAAALVDLARLGGGGGGGEARDVAGAGPPGGGGRTRGGGIRPTAGRR